MRDVLCLLLQASQASPRFRSSETQTTSTVFFAATLTVCSVSFAESTMSTFTAPKESLKIEAKHYHMLFWNFPFRFLINLNLLKFDRTCGLAFTCSENLAESACDLFPFIVKLEVVSSKIAILLRNVVAPFFTVKSRPTWSLVTESSVHTVGL